MDDIHIGPLRKAYDADAERRDETEPDPWRLSLVELLAERLVSSGRRSVVDLGCGTGQLAAHLQSLGLTVSAIDLSAENVARTLARTIDAQLGDFTATPFAAAPSTAPLPSTASSTCRRQASAVRSPKRAESFAPGPWP